MEKDTAGELLTKALVQVTKDLQEIITEDSTYNQQDLDRITKKVIRDMNSELRKEERVLLQGSLEVLLLALANYSLIEKEIFKKSGLNYSTNRVKILNKVFEIMSEDL
jgi:hypothetical protein